MDIQNQNEIQKSIIDEFGLAGLSEDKQKELIEKMTEVIIKQVLLETFDKLSEADQDELGKMMENNPDPSKIENFLMQKVPGFQDMVARIAKNFREEMKKDLGVKINQ